MILRTLLHFVSTCICTLICSLKQESQTSSVLKRFRDVCELSAMNNITGLFTILPLQGREGFLTELLYVLPVWKTDLHVTLKAGEKIVTIVLQMLAQKLTSCLGQLWKSISVQIVVDNSKIVRKCDPGLI